MRSATANGALPLLRILLILAAGYSAAHFLVVAYREPLVYSLHDAGSHQDLRGPYIAALDLRHGDNPYLVTEKNYSSRWLSEHRLERMKAGYSPEALAGVYLPLTFMAFPAAKVCWLTLNVLLLGAIGFLLLCMTKAPRNLPGFLVTFCLLADFMPLARNLEIGQNNIPILFFLCAGIVALNAGRQFLAGILLCCTVFFKPFPAVVFAAFLFRGQTRVLLGAAATALAGVLLIRLAFGPDVHPGYFLEAYQRSSVATWWANQSIPAVCARLFSSNAHSVPWLDSPGIAWGLTLLCSAVILANTVRTALKHPDAPWALSLSAWLLTGMLLSPRTLDHYVSWLVIPLAWLLWHFIAQRRWAMSAGMVLIYGLLSYNGIRWSVATGFHQGPGLILTGSQAIGILLLYGIVIHEHFHKNLARIPATIPAAV